MTKLNWYQSTWGIEDLNEDFFRRTAEEGYTGIEGNIDNLPEDTTKIREYLKEYGLRYAALIKTDGEDHFEVFKRNCDRALALDAAYINSHTGRDKMSFAEQDELFGKVLEYQKGLPAPVYHETHRSRPTFSPFGALRLAEEFPDLLLTADFSHWCCVCESLLLDMPETMERLCSQVGHIHARVGYHEGPQAPDPAAPEYADALKVHEDWWKSILRHHDGETMTVVPEYGPASSAYLHTLPYTNVPVSDMLTVRSWAKERFEKMAGEI